MPFESVPTAILEMRGSRWAAAKEGEPDAPRGRPRRPAWVKPVPGATECWNRTCSALDAMGLLHSTDWAAIGRYAVALARWVQVQTELTKAGQSYTAVRNEHGGIVETKPLGQWRILESLERELARLEKQFGLTPAARRGLAVQRESDPNENRGKGSKGGTVRARLFGGA